jgi:hypothetical protein
VISSGADLRPLTSGVVYHQADRPLCAPFATSLAHEIERRQKQLPIEPLAPEPLWRYAHRAGLTSDAGMPIGAVREALRADGQPHLSEWPFNESLGDSTEEPPTLIGGAPWLTAQSDSVAVAKDGIESDIRAVLDSGSAVVLVVGVTASFWSAGGTVDPSPTDQLWGWHAVTCLGYENGGILRLLIQNSWGEGWGDGGLALVSADYLARWSLDQAFRVVL